MFGIAPQNGVRDKLKPKLQWGRKFLILKQMSELQSPKILLKLYAKKEYIELWEGCVCVLMCSERLHSLHQNGKVKTLTPKTIQTIEPRESWFKPGTTLVSLVDSKN